HLDRGDVGHPRRGLGARAEGAAPSSQASGNASTGTTSRVTDRAKAQGRPGLPCRGPADTSRSRYERDAFWPPPAAWPVKYSALVMRPKPTNSSPHTVRCGTLL